MEKVTSVSQLASLAQKIKASQDPDQPRFTICGGTGCRANNSYEFAQVVAKELGARGLDAKVELKLSGCHGLCQKGPVVVVDPMHVFYQETGIKDPARMRAFIATVRAFRAGVEAPPGERGE